MEIGGSERSKSKRDLMVSLNNKFKRKRIISIYFLIRKILQQMGCNGYQTIDLKISNQTLEKYERWWRLIDPGFISKSFPAEEIE